MKIISKKRKVVAIYQILLLVSISFAFSFILSDNSVSATAAAPTGFIAGVGDALGGTLFTGAAPAVGAPAAGAVIGNALIAGVLQGALWAGIGLVLAELLGLEGKARNALISAGAAGGVVFGILSAYTAAGTALVPAVAPVAATGLGGFLGIGTPAIPGVAAQGTAGTLFGTTGATASFLSFAIPLAIAAIVFIYMYKDSFEQKVSFVCEPYQAPLGGDDCEECNEDEDCTEYECRALGQGCKIVNAGTDIQACVWVDRNDIISPVITPWEDANRPGEIEFTNHQSRPPSLGVQLIDSGTGSNCLRPYTPIVFGLQTDEPATCKLSYNHTDSIEDMSLQFVEGIHKVYNHTGLLSLPDPNAENIDATPLLQPDGTFSLFVRCNDENGNENVDEFAVSFCVDANPDISAPRIEGFNINSGSHVRYDVEEVLVELYTNEYASCKWSLLDQDYANMENDMSCVVPSGKTTATISHTCAGILTGVENYVENKYYFACADTEGNEMVEREEFVLIGSQELNILGFTPEVGDVITGSTASVEVELTVETDDGAEEGVSSCYYKSQEGIPKNYVTMFNTNSFEHSQPGILLTSGDYAYDIKCVDAGGNEAVETTTFTVFVDDDAPNAVRAYKQAPNSLRVITEEDASCVYDFTSCNYEFDLGQPMLHPTADSKNIQLAEWQTGKTYYIKCRDEFGNEPSSNDCSIIVKTV